MHTARKLPGSKSLEEVAMILIMRPARTPAGREVQATVLARIEAAIAASKPCND